VARVPAYERIRDTLRIEIKQLGPGGRLPSETDLAERFGVTRATVRNAVDGLIADGLVQREHGRGTFVQDGAARVRRLARLTSFTQDLAEQGLIVDTTVLVQEEQPASTEVAKALGIKSGDAVAHIERLRSTDGEPVAYQQAWVPIAICPSLALEPLGKRSLYEVFEQRYGVRLRKAEQWISAAAATRTQAGHLGVRAGSPLLHTRRITFDERGRRVELALSWTRPQYQLTALLER
jgi:GntR family transcriptional regulator